ncbi:MAG TPA: hypothetical protein VIH71_14270 [Solirubrobacteraceae bacterium]|jgi:hypothetical protein
MNDEDPQAGSADPVPEIAKSVPSPPAQLLDPKTEATVDALLETVRHLLDEENSRDQSFNTRGVGLAGFVGIVVSLSTTLGHDALAADWGAPWKGIAVGLFAGALASLVGSVVVVVLRVLRPREAASLGIAEVEKYPLPEYIYAPKVMNQGSTMRGLIDALVIERSRAGSKATGLHWGYRLLLVGLACISILGFLLGLHDAKLIGVPHARRAIRPAAACTRTVGAECSAGHRPRVSRGRAISVRQPKRRSSREGR